MCTFHIAKNHCVSNALQWRHNDHDGVSITSLTVVYSTVCSDADQRKHQSSASLAFAWGFHRDRWILRTKAKLRGKCFHLMTSSCGHFMNTYFISVQLQIFVILVNIILYHRRLLAPGGCHSLAALEWRHNGGDGITNDRRLDWLLNNCSGAYQRTYQSSASLTFSREFRWWPRHHIRMRRNLGYRLNGIAQSVNWHMGMRRSSLMVGLSRLHPPICHVR